MRVYAKARWLAFAMLPRYTYTYTYTATLAFLLENIKLYFSARAVQTNRQNLTRLMVNHFHRHTCEGTIMR